VERSGTHQPRANNTEGKTALKTETAEYRSAEYENQPNHAPGLTSGGLNDSIDLTDFPIPTA